MIKVPQGVLCLDNIDGRCGPVHDLPQKRPVPLAVSIQPCPLTSLEPRFTVSSPSPLRPCTATAGNCRRTLHTEALCQLPWRLLADSGARGLFAVLTYEVIRTVDNPLCGRTREEVGRKEQGSYSPETGQQLRRWGILVGSNRPNNARLRTPRLDVQPIILLRLGVKKAPEYHKNAALCTLESHKKSVMSPSSPF